MTAQTQSTPTQTTVFLISFLDFVFANDGRQITNGPTLLPAHFPFSKANLHISDHPHVVYGNAPSQHPAGLDLGYTRDVVPGSSSSTSLTYLGTIPSTVANGQNTRNFYEFGNAKFLFLRFFFLPIPFFRSAQISVFSVFLFRFFVFVPFFCPVVSSAT